MSVVRRHFRLKDGVLTMAYDRQTLMEGRPIYSISIKNASSLPDGDIAGHIDMQQEAGAPFVAALEIINLLGRHFATHLLLDIDTGVFDGEYCVEQEKKIETVELTNQDATCELMAISLITSRALCVMWREDYQIFDNSESVRKANALLDYFDIRADRLEAELAKRGLYPVS